MKKIALISTLAVFLSGLATQAVSTISWDFNTLGNTEGWTDTGDSLNSLTNGIIVTNAVLGAEVVLTTPDITGGDPGLVTTVTNSVPVGEYWETIEIRLRTLASNGGSPTTYNENATLMVINGNVISPGVAWDKTYEADEWVVTSYDISSLGSNDVTYLRLDPPASENQNFEYDYIKLHSNTNAPPPPVYKTDWEFNTPGDTEGWAGNVVGLKIANAVVGFDSVLTCDSAAVSDPQVANTVEPANIEPGKYWSAVEVRIRLVQSGSPIPWVPGDLFRINGSTVSSQIGGSDWDTTTEADEWVVTRFDMSYLGQANITYMRIDPFGAASGRNFEIDYIRFETRNTPVLPPAPVELVHGWEFNMPGDTEDITTRTSPAEVIGLTAATAITGSEGVLTCSDIAGLDPWVFYNDAFANPSLAITPPGPWSTLELRIRTLSGNPGDGGTTSIPFEGGGTLFQLNPWTGATILTATAATPEADNWLVVTYDISYLGLANLDSFRLDPVGNDNLLNFEVDYIRVYSQGNSYDAWSQSLYGLSGTNALELADADLDTYNNLYEYAFGGDPTNAADHGLIETGSVEDGGTNWFEYVYARRTGFNTGLEYDLQLKDDLVVGSWTGIGDTAVVGTMQADDDYEIVTNRIETVDSQKFLNLEVTGE